MREEEEDGPGLCRRCRGNEEVGDDGTIRLVLVVVVKVVLLGLLDKTWIDLLLLVFLSKKDCNLVAAQRVKVLTARSRS